MTSVTAKNAETPRKRSRPKRRMLRSRSAASVRRKASASVATGRWCRRRPVRESMIPRRSETWSRIALVFRGLAVLGFGCTTTRAHGDAAAGAADEGEQVVDVGRVDLGLDLCHRGGEVGAL